MNFRIEVDYGKPYKIETKTPEEAIKELHELRRLFNSEDFPYFDVKVFIIEDGKETDITEKISIEAESSFMM